MNFTPLLSVRAVWLFNFAVFACLAFTAASTAAAPVTIDEPGFEADGAWRFAQTGAGVNGFFGKDHADYIDAGLIDPLPGRGKFFAYNNGSQHDLYQVLAATLAEDTTYTLSIAAIHPTFAKAFPGGELRLGFVSASPTVADDYGLNLLKSGKVVNPMPLNDVESEPGNPSDGIATWAYTFSTGTKPVGFGRQLRIEILGGGGVQSVFDNVRLEATATAAGSSEAPVTESSKRGPVVVMLGDSTTDRGMPTVVKEQLDRLMASPEQRPTVINAGKGGDNATSALDRLEKDVLAHHPDIVTVSFGLNDTGGRKPEQFEESLKQMIEILKAAGIQIVLMTSTPFNNDRHGWGKQFEELGGIDEYMDREFCEKMRCLADDEEVLLCDLHAIFRAEIKKDADLINKLISRDGAHLTVEGYDLVAEHIAPLLHELLTGEPVESSHKSRRP